MDTANDETTIAKNTLTERVYQDLVSRSRRGEFTKPGRLPSIPKLAAHYRVSEITIRAAVRALDAGGVVNRRRHGSRTAFSSPLISTSSIVVLGERQSPGSPIEAAWQSEVLGIYDQIHAEGYHSLSINPSMFTEDVANKLAREGIAGAVIPDAGSAEKRARWAHQLRSHGIHVVLSGSEPEFEPFDCVRSDQVQGNYELTRWILEQGRRRILPLWAAPGDRTFLLERLAGYRRAMAEAGMEPMDPLVWSWGNVDAFASGGLETVIHLAAGQLVTTLNSERPPDAIMVSSDGELPYIAEVCRLFGKRVHDDIMLTGYDNYWNFMPEDGRPGEPPAATIDKQQRVIGGECIKLLLERVAGRLPGNAQKRTIAPQLKVLKSNALIK